MTRKTYERVMNHRKRQDLWLRAAYLEDKDKAAQRMAFHLTKIAVTLGETEARQSLAYSYDTGRGVRPSRRMALHLYRKAWRDGVATAANNYGVTMRMEGRISTAALWFRQAIALGDPDAKFLLASLYLDDPTRRSEVLSLLHEYLAAGPQTYYTYGQDVEPLKVEDEDYKEAQQVLQELTSQVAQ